MAGGAGRGKLDQLATGAAGGPLYSAVAPVLASALLETYGPVREQRGKRGVFGPVHRVAKRNVLDPRVGRAVGLGAGPAQAALVSVCVYAGMQEPSGPLGRAVDHEPAAATQCGARAVRVRGGLLAELKLGLAHWLLCLDLRLSTIRARRSSSSRAEHRLSWLALGFCKTAM